VARAYYKVRPDKARKINTPRILDPVRQS